MDILTYINRMNQIYGNGQQAAPVYNTQKYLQGGRVGYRDAGIVKSMTKRYSLDDTVVNELNTLYDNITNQKSIHKFPNKAKTAVIEKRLTDFATEFKRITGRLPVLNEIQAFGASSTTATSTKKAKYMKKGINFMEETDEMKKTKRIDVVGTEIEQKILNLSKDPKYIKEDGTPNIKKLAKDIYPDQKLDDARKQIRNTLKRTIDYKGKKNIPGEITSAKQSKKNAREAIKIAQKKAGIPTTKQSSQVIDKILSQNEIYQNMSVENIAKDKDFLKRLRLKIDSVTGDVTFDGYTKKSPVRGKVFTDLELAQHAKDKSMRYELFTPDHITPKATRMQNVGYPINLQATTYMENSQLTNGRTYLKKNPDGNWKPIDNYLSSKNLTIRGPEFKQKYGFKLPIKFNPETGTSNIVESSFNKTIKKYLKKFGKAGAITTSAVTLPSIVSASESDVTESSMVPKIISENPLKSAAVGTGAALTQKPVRNFLGKTVRTLGTPLSGLGFSGWTAYDNLKAGESLADAVIDPLVGGELLFPSLFVENVAKITKSPTLQKVLGLGKFGSRVMPITGTTITLAGLTKDATQEIINEARRIDAIEDSDQQLEEQDMLVRNIKGYADGGRISFGKGKLAIKGIDKSRRAFMKLLAGLGIGTATAGAGLLKFGKGVKTVAPQVTEEVIKRGADGIPNYAWDLIKVVKAKGIKKIVDSDVNKYPDTVHSYKGVEVIDEMGLPYEMGGVTRIKRPTEGVATDASGKMHEGISKEIEMEIKPSDNEVFTDPESGMSWYIEPGKGRRVYETKPPDEYMEGTVRPDNEGKMKDFEEGIDDVDHLELKKIADEGTYDTSLPDIDDID